MKNPITKSLIIVLFVSLLAGACSKDDSEAPQTSESLKGKVKVITEYVYSGIETNGVVQKSKLGWRTVMKYNENGKITESQSFDSDGPGYKETYTYNEKGKLIEHRTDESASKKYLYDEKGNSSETVAYYGTQIEYRVFYKTDGAGRIAESTKDVNWLGVKSVYHYDGAGNLTEILGLESDGSPSGKKVFKYDQNKNLIEEGYYFSDGTLEMKFSYKYLDFDNTGNWIKMNEFDLNVAKNIDVIRSITEREIEYYQ